jgi:hypothetical protein
MQKVRPWELWDWKSIRNLILLLIVVGGASILFFGLPDWLHDSNSQLLTAKTDGKLIRTEYIKQPSMGRTGNHLRVTSIVIEYSYIVNGLTYYSKDKIPNSTKHQRFFGNLTDNPAMILEIKYNPGNPQDSQITTNTE